MTTADRDIGALNALLRDAGLSVLTELQLSSFDRYLELILKWNERINLTAVRSREDIIRRHFLEGVVCAQNLPCGIRSLLDLGSGAGLPGIPIAIWNPELAVTLAESKNKKASFLNEVVRTLGLNAEVFAGRAEHIQSRFDCVTLRAVDRMREAIETGISLLADGGWMAVLTSESHEHEIAAIMPDRINWKESTRLPAALSRSMLIGNSVPRGTVLR